MKADELLDDPKAKVIIVGNIGTTYVELGDFEKALNSYNKAYKLSGRLFYKIQGAYCLARSGNSSLAVKSVESLSTAAVLQADSSGNEGLAAYNMAAIYALAKHAPEAVEWLKMALSQNSQRFVVGVRKDTDFASIRSTSEFKRLIANISSK